MKRLIIFFILWTNAFAFAKPVTFEKVQDFHDKRIKTLLENYGFNDELDVSVLISPMQMKSLNRYKKKIRVRLPGLLLGGIEAPEEKQTVGVFEILQSLKDYKRDVSIIKKKNVSDAEIAALTAGLKEYLALRNDEKITIQNRVFNFSDAMRNWRSDLASSVYTSFFKANFWAWIPVLLILALMFSGMFISALRKSFKGLGESIEKSATHSAEDIMAASAQSEVNQDPSGDFNDIIETEVDQVFEVDPISIYEKLVNLHTKSKYELFSILWETLPRLEKQISFYEVITAELDVVQLETFKSIFFEVFQLKPKSILQVRSGNYLTAAELAKIHKILLVAELVDPNPIREEALSAVYPKYGNQINKVIESSIEQFFSVIYYLFPDVASKILTSSPELASKVATKVMFYLARPEEEREPTTLELKSFTKFIETETFLKLGSVVSIDPKALKLLYNLSDAAIFKAEGVSQGYLDQLRLSLPNLSWINDGDLDKLKGFFLGLNPAELRYLSTDCENFVALYNALDDRGKYRVSEKLEEAQNQSVKLNVPVLRDKIKKYFSSPEAESLASSNQVLENAA